MTRYKKTMSEAYRDVYNLTEKMSSSQIAKLKKAYEPMRGKKISTGNAEKLMKIMDMVDKDKNVLIQLFKADIPFVSELAVTRLITKHKMKGAEINKLKSEALDEAMLNLSTVKFQAKDALGKIRHKVTQKGKKYIISVDSNDEEDAQKAMKDHPLYVAGKLRVVPEEVELDEKVEYVEYKFRNKNDAMKAKAMLDATNLMSFEINDDNISGGELMVDAGNKDMTKFHKEIMKKFRPKVLTQESLEEKFSPKEIKMAIGIASDKRYARGNYTGAVNAIEKIKKGLSKHKQVAAVLKRQNEELDESKEALKKKAEKSGVSVGILSKVYDRGMAAWKGGHRPGTTPQQWALARVNSFLTGGGARKADNDLWQKAKKEEVELDEAKEVLSRFRDDKLKQSIMNLAKQKGLKVKDMGDKIEVSGNGRKVMDLTLAVQKQDVKINEDAVKAAQDKLDKAKRIQSLKDRIKDIRDEGARSDAMRAMRTKRGVDPADVDNDATDDDMKAASKNILMQLRKSVSLGKNFKVEFGDKKKMPVDPKIAQAVINKYMSFRKPMDKEKFQSKIAKSYKDMILTMKENIHEEDKPDNTKFTDRIKKAQERVKNATRGTQEHSDAIDALKNAQDAYAEYKKKSAGKLKRAGDKIKSGLKKTATGLKKTAIATGIGAIATAKLGDNYDPRIKREAILDRIDKKLEEKNNG